VTLPSSFTKFIERINHRINAPNLSLEATDISLKLGLGMADSIIVATAKAYNAQIITSDKHLKGIEDVRFIGGDS